MSQIGWVEPTTTVPANPTTAVDNGDGTGTITNPDGTTVPFCAECPEINTHELDEDGNLVITSPDGTATTYVINNNTLLGPYTDPDGDGIYTAEVLDADGNPTGDTVDSDFNALISSPHPEPIPDTFMSATVNADGSITLQYNNADGPVGDPIVIPAPCVCLTLDTEANIDNGGDAAKAVSGADLHKYVDPHHQSFGITRAPTDLPPQTVMISKTLTAPEDGIYTASFQIFLSSNVPDDLLFLNGGVSSPSYGIQSIYPPDTPNTGVWGTGSVELELNAGDTVDYYLYQYSTTSTLALAQCWISGDLTRVVPRKN